MDMLEMFPYQNMSILDGGILSPEGKEKKFSLCHKSIQISFFINDGQACLFNIFDYILGLRDL